MNLSVVPSGKITSKFQPIRDTFVDNFTKYCLIHNNGSAKKKLITDVVDCYLLNIIVEIRSFPLSIEITRQKSDYSGKEYSFSRNRDKISYKYSILFQEFLRDEYTCGLEIGGAELVESDSGDYYKMNSSYLHISNNLIFSLLKIIRNGKDNVCLPRNGTDYLFLRVGKNKDLVKFKETSFTRNIRKELEFIDNFLQDVFVCHPSDDIFSVKTYSQRYVRIFRDTFEWCGRAYCHSVQGIRSEDRLSLLIDGHTVSELDYKAMQPSIIADKLGFVFEDDFDPYSTKTPLFNSLGELGRKLYKGIILRYLNRNSERGFKVSINTYKADLIKDLYEKDIDSAIMIKNLDFNDLIKDMLVYNPYFNDFKPSIEVYKVLQRWDADIIVECAKHMSKNKIPFIMVHDSIVTPTIYEKDVEKIMRMAYNTIIGSDKNCVIKISKLNNEPKFYKDFSKQEDFQNRFLEVFENNVKFRRL